MIFELSMVILMVYISLVVMAQMRLSWYFSIPDFRSSVGVVDLMKYYFLLDGLENLDFKDEVKRNVQFESGENYRRFLIRFRTYIIPLSVISGAGLFFFWQ